MTSLAALAVAAAFTAVPFQTDRAPVDSYGSTVVFSSYDAAAGTYGLAVIRGSGPVEPVPVASQPVPFDVDIGPGPDGTPTLVYSRCAKPQPPAPSGCDLYSFALAPGATERPISAANTGKEEFAPTIYGNRIAFARAASRFPTAEIPRVYTRTFTGSSKEKSVQLPGVPARECAAGRCVKTMYGRVDELELGTGSRLAEVVEAGPGTGDNATVEVRLARLSGSSVTVARTIPGPISVRKTYLGLSLESHELSFARILFYGGDTAFRYRTDRGTYGSAAIGRDTYGMAAAGGARYWLAQQCRSCAALPLPPGAGADAVPPVPLALAESAALTFKPASAPIKPRS